MNTKELLDYHKGLCDTARHIMAKKNHDYAGASGDTPFANFEVAEQLGICKNEAGLLLRITDKIKRLITYTNSGELKVKNEGAEDAILDCINYFILLGAYIKQKQEKEEENGNTSSNTTNTITPTDLHSAQVYKTR